MENWGKPTDGNGGKRKGSQLARRDAIKSQARDKKSISINQLEDGSTPDKTWRPGARHSQGRKGRRETPLNRPRYTRNGSKDGQQGRYLRGRIYVRVRITTKHYHSEYATNLRTHGHLIHGDDIEVIFTKTD